MAMAVHGNKGFLYQILYICIKVREALFEVSTYMRSDFLEEYQVIRIAPRTGRNKEFPQSVLYFCEVLSSISFHGPVRLQAALENTRSPAIHLCVILLGDFD